MVPGSSEDTPAEASANGQRGAGASIAPALAQTVVRQGLSRNRAKGRKMTVLSAIHLPPGVPVGKMPR